MLICKPEYSSVYKWSLFKSNRLCSSNHPIIMHFCHVYLPDIENSIWKYVTITREL